ncbi:MAG TPA: histidine kinase dimerization/phosphoacceptor domain -containing protein, partial [Dissulfurispiraceae bacterium]|nr:histidine kinase dimerization/phosphoacceptor domain -containing protein [Dissulfurispiraceae bacterium]
QRLAYALRAANAGAWEWDMRTNCAIWSEGNYHVLGLVPGSAPSCYELWLRCVHPDDREEAERRVRESVEQRKDLDITFRVVWPDGTIHWLNDIGSMMFDETGDPAGMYGIQIDITERKHAELKQAGLAGILENSLNEIYLFDADTLRFLFVNRSARENLGYSLEELQRLSPVDIKPEYDNESFVSLLQPLISGAKAKIEFTTVHQRKAGSVYPVEVHLQPGVYESRPVFSAFILDISERRRMERDLRESLRGKETLLKEIHHRVKNNLQVISSLLDLQARYIEDRQALDAFRESERRVRSMALIHDQLYSIQDTERIGFSQYVESLMTYLFQSFSAEARSVMWSADIPVLFLSLDTATPCGLIINELVMNCLKHAFPGGRPGHVRVRIDADADGKLTLCVTDDGVGFPSGFDPGQTDSLGLTIVRTLVRQLRGAMDIRHAGPAEITITFRESRGEGG